MHRGNTVISAALLGLLFGLGLIGNASAQSVMEINELISIGASGDSAAQFELGNRYLNGTGVTQDNFEALRWFALAAEKENPNAQYNIAVMYLNGIGVVKDPQQAIHWFLRAANNGDTPSQFTLGVALFNGQLGVPQNTAEAYKWFTLAGAAGHQAAAANAVLIQEMLPPENVVAMQEAARVWISDFTQRQSSEPSLQTSTSGDSQP